LKVLFLQEHVREDHMKKNAAGEFKNVFFQTKGGNILKKIIDQELKLKRGEYSIDYAYNLVPKVVTRNKFNKKAVKYKPPTQKETAPQYKELYKRIVREKPDIIIPTGKLGCKALINSSSITKVRGVPQRVTITADPEEGTTEAVDKVALELEKVRLEDQLENIDGQKRSFLQLYQGRQLDKQLAEDFYKLEERESQLDEALDDILIKLRSQEETTDSHECWVLPMYSIEYMLVKPNVQRLIEADMTILQKFLQQGNAAFEASPVEYEFVENIERVRDIFENEIPKAPVIAWDLETNTLKPELKGAKPLVCSLSWEEGTGVTIPLEHKDAKWLPGHLAELYNYIEKFVADPDIVKVGHNLQYDQKFLRLTKGFTEFRNHRDTKIMYYTLINQEVEGSLKLSDLAYELTDMGGYDRPLEEFKKQYIEEKTEEAKYQIAQAKEAYKQQVAAERAAHKAQTDAIKEQYKEAVKLEEQRAKEEGREPYFIPAPPMPKLELPPKPDFPKAEAPKNEIDGGDFNYEWIPLVKMLHPYASGDVDACLRIHNRLDAIGLKPENARIRELYTGHYTHLTAALASIEANGVKMDVPYTEGLVEAYTGEEERIVQQMREFDMVKQLEQDLLSLYQRGLEEWMKPKAERDPDIAALRDKYKDGHTFNPNSSEHKKKVLFYYTGHKLPYNKEYIVSSAMEDELKEEEIEWHHYKTNKTTLEYIKDHFEESAELASLLLTHSLVKTRKQGFTYKLLNMRDHRGLIHGNFNSTGTETSRLASSAPNLQNIPRKTGNVKRFDYQHPIKRMFTTSFENGALLQLDYSSLESRVLALAAGDEEMTQAFLDGADIHKETASLVYGVPITQVTDDMRSDSKAVTFGLA
jgi:DNA polymerase I-like protein with 3'-5' exonuclease and polymerase domains